MSITPQDGPSTVRFKVSPYVAFIMSGSDIVSEHGGGYDVTIGEEYRKKPNGGTWRLSGRALRDLAEFCEALAISEADGGNQSGARSLGKHRERALEAARDLLVLEGEVAR